MSLGRRDVVRLAVGGALSGAMAGPSSALEFGEPRFKAIAFDAFPIFDPRPVGALTERLFPGKGADLTNAWRTRQFEYQWLRALSGRYADFWQTTDDALTFAAASLGINLTSEARKQLMQTYLELKAWPDALPALQALRASGVRLAFLSNMTTRMLETGIKDAGLDGVFEHILSTDGIKSYKPDPRAYQMAVDAFKLTREEILFVAFAGWDAAGAKWFGYPTFWVNRLGLPAEQLGVVPDASLRGLDALVSFMK